MEIVNNNISLKELLEMENISVRTQNICEWNDLEDLFSILHFYWENNDFYKLRNCGQKSNIELTSLCRKYENFDFKLFHKPLEIPVEKPILQKIDRLTVRQKKILNSIIESRASELSVRGYNALEKHLNANFNIKELALSLADESFQIKYLKNIGIKTEKELIIFFETIKKQIEIISLFENDAELTIELFNSFLVGRFRLIPTIITEIWRDYDSSNGLPLFKTCNILIEHEILFDKRERAIFEKGMNYLHDEKPFSLKELAISIGVTKERTRQLRNTIFDKLNSIFLFIKGFEFECLNLYGIDINSDLITISDELIFEINQKEKNSFNLHFINKLLSILLENSHTLIGNERTIVLERSNNSRISYEWNCNYLIKREIVDVFSFDEFINDIYRRLNDRNEEDYSFHFETYLLKFQKNKYPFISREIIEISEHMLFNEFYLSLDSFDNIIFKRNTFKQVGDYIFDILNENNAPLSIYDIYEQLSLITPDITRSVDALRVSCQRDPNFIYFGRSSTYGLKKWQDADIVKGGTMHDISEEYLEQFDGPKHIDEILKYVLNYREDITSKNLLYNLKSAEKRRFLFFKDNHIGLVSKTYGKEFYHLIKDNIERKTWEGNFILLEGFVFKNNRLPKNTGDEYEQKLYRYLNIQLNKVNKGLIEENKLMRILTIVEPFQNNIRRKRSCKNHKHTLEELNLFIRKHKRLPKANDDNEKTLYQFYYRQAKRYRNGNLTDDLRNKYNEINNLIVEIYGN